MRCSNGLSKGRVRMKQFFKFLLSYFCAEALFHLIIGL